MKRTLQEVSSRCIDDLDTWEYDSLLDDIVRLSDVVLKKVEELSDGYKVEDYELKRFLHDVMWIQIASDRILTGELKHDTRRKKECPPALNRWAHSKEKSSGKRLTITADMAREMANMRLSGSSVAHIAAHFGVSDQTVRKYLGEYQKQHPGVGFTWAKNVAEGRERRI